MRDEKFRCGFLVSQLYVTNATATPDHEPTWMSARTWKARTRLVAAGEAQALAALQFGRGTRRSIRRGDIKTTEVAIVESYFPTQ